MQLKLHENKIDGIFVEGLLEYNVNEYRDCIILMHRGERNRYTRQTLMNRKSSRSHTIFQIKIESGVVSKKGNLFVNFFPLKAINCCVLEG